MPNAANRILLAIAAPSEFAAVCRGMGASAEGVAEWQCRVVSPRIDAVLTGIGKSNAAGAVARHVRPEHRLIVSVGIAGVFPPREFRAGERVLASESVFADEGVETGATFLSTAQIGFAMPGVGELALRPTQEIIALLRPLVDGVGVIATVSTCAGTDARSRDVVARSGATCEAMEGAAVGLVAQRLGAMFAEVRVISNTTGERSRQRWDIRSALESISVFSAGLVESWEHV